ncbi:MAG: ABC transporter ATP-binding protein [Chloroflexota bacterium]
MGYLLDVQNLVTRFRTPQGTVHAVNGISYRLERGESLAIVGESGSGKTVSALSLLGLLPSDSGIIESGEIWFNSPAAGERNLAEMSERELQQIRGKEISMIFQDPMTTLNPMRTIGSQLVEGLKWHLGLNGRSARSRALELLDLVGIPNPTQRFSDYPHQFSGGQRQRIIIAIALSCDPLLLIADEPTTALDVTIQAQILKLIKRLKAELGMSIIWITHDLGVVAGLVDKVAVMYAGQIVEMADVRDLYKRSSHPYTLGLLESLPHVDAQERRRLVPINGRPPTLLESISHCPFLERCRYAIERCQQDNPPLIPVAPNHTAACWRGEELFTGNLEISNWRFAASTVPNHQSPITNHP